MSIADNVRAVLENAARAAERSGRSPADVTVIGVTKTVGAADVAEMARAGISIAGENRVQELVPKRAELCGAFPGLRWHMIGHLQTNKVRQAVQAADMIHSVDSLRLAERIDAEAEKAGKVMDIAAEVNIAAEASKYGFSPDAVFEFMERASVLRHINIRGLMCVAPFVENPQENRPFFQKMTKILLDINEKLFHNRKMDVLSMGMTMDYVAAIEEGATMVRVGTAVFGART